MTETNFMRRAAARRVHEILEVLESFFPSSLAEEWDRIGLQVGSAAATVKRVGVALDPSPEAVRQTAGGLLVTHHPLLFHPLARLDTDTPVGATVAEAIRRRTAIVACHTNADWAAGGVNDVLAQRLGLLDVRPWEPLYPVAYRKLTVFVPESHLAAVSEAVFQAGGGVIGNYAKCSYRLRGEGTYLPRAGATPYSGRPGELSVENEVRLEVRVPAANVTAVLEAMKATHPYEEVAFDLFPTERQNPAGGRGRLGRLPKPQTLAALARWAARRRRAPAGRFVGDGATRIERLLLCGGAGAGFIDALAGRPGDALLTGDLKYHEALQARERRVPVIDLGHFATEYPFIESLAARLTASLSPLPVFVCRTDSDPFSRI
ncbi:MAG: Nif3-like dinuclear metal center hexameric protein [Myxococcales bacterium]|nr:Nif3-like dinuclear metal center hexameric protein [Myxococcales bacterium]